ncbi:MAG: type I-C CRISPR-associated protein Cas8c/Csd1 [archaeon]
MIIQELCHYYDRLRDNPDMDISEPGFSREKIHAEVVLDENGNLLQFNDLRIQKGKNLVPKEMIVPQSFKRPGSKAHEAPFFLWDNTGFVFGKDAKENNQKTQLKFENFRRHHVKLLSQSTQKDVQIFVSFLSNWNISNANNLKNWKELAGGNVVFRIDGEREYLHEKKSLKEIWLQYLATQKATLEGFCMITGKRTPIARTHPSVKSFSSTGSALVSFNDNAYESYGKKQNYNAPVGEMSAFTYTTALNYLLASNSKQKIRIGDDTAVFWTERQSPVEGMLGQILDPKDTELADSANIKQFLEAVRDSKKLPDIDCDIKFYILGISPNKARIAVRFWHICTVGQLKERIGQHFKDLQMIRSRDSDPEFPSIWRLLQETINKKSSDTPQPLLAGAVMRSILEGTVYPQALQNALINRIRSESALKDKNGKPINNVNYVRAAMLKAILNQKNRIYKNSMEVPMALDKENKNTAYLLGRLFAVLEKVQQDALGQNINATIKDRFFGSASATPAAVFPQLLRLAQHHIGKAEYGKTRDKQIEEVICDIKDFPAHLSLDQQGLFAIGYYHQRQSFFQKKDKE